MTWTDDTSSSSPTWTGSGSTVLSWTAPSTSFASGNFSRFVDADPLPDGSGGLDFANTFSTENPWAFSTRGSIAFTATNRENP